MVKRLGVLGTALVLLAMMTAMTATASTSFGIKYTIPAVVSLTGVGKACDNTGTTIDLSGGVTLGSLGLTLKFENNTTSGPGHHVAVVDTIATLGLIDFGVSSINKGSSTGVGGNPWIFIRLHSDSDAGEWVLVGRCVQGFLLNKVVNVGAFASLILSALDCNNRGPSIGVDGDVGDGGIDADVYFTNNQNKPTDSTWKHSLTTGAGVTVGLSPSVHVHKQGSVGGPGGNPLVSGEFVGKGINSVWTFLGRCNKI